MNEETAIEQELRRSVRPDPEDVPKHGFHCLKRDQADSVVGEVHRHICEHHQTGKEPQPPDHRRTRQSRCRTAKRLVTGAPFLLPGPTSTSLTSVRAGSSGCRASENRNITVLVGIAFASD